MTSTGWIIGAIVIVGIGIAAGLLFTGGTEAQVIVAESSKGTGIVYETRATTIPARLTPEPVQEDAPTGNELMSVPEVANPIAGSDDTGSAVTVSSIDELIAGARAYANKEVIVRGSIVTQCIRGCQFSLEDGTGIVGVELIDDALDNVLTVGNVGRQIEVRGTIESSPSVVIVVEDPDNWRYLD
ncbi:hypothetical protein ACFLSZ_04235 [Candidatus Bipolaricaulota bacterium]